MQEPGPAHDRPVRINVGGQVFYTTCMTLCSTSGHILARIFPETPDPSGVQGTAIFDEQGIPFIDRDPRWFSAVLSYLRDGYVPLPPSLYERQQLFQEARYYGLEGLAETIQQADPDAVAYGASSTDWPFQLPSKEVAAARQQFALQGHLTAGLGEIAVGFDRVVASLDALPVSKGRPIKAAIHNGLGRIARRLEDLAQTVAGNGSFEDMAGSPGDETESEDDERQPRQQPAFAPPAPAQMPLGPQPAFILVGQEQLARVQQMQEQVGQQGLAPLMAVPLGQDQQQGLPGLGQQLEQALLAQLQQGLEQLQPGQAAQLQQQLEQGQQEGQEGQMQLEEQQPGQEQPGGQEAGDDLDEDR